MKLSFLILCLLRATFAQTEEFSEGFCKFGADDLILWGLTYVQCLDECRARDLCTSVNANLGVGQCRLSFDYTVPEVPCEFYILSEKSDWEKKRLCNEDTQCAPQINVKTTTECKCKIEECLPLSVPDNGVLMGTGRLVGHRVVVGCKNERDIITEYHQRNCTVKGVWSGETVVCQAVGGSKQDPITPTQQTTKTTTQATNITTPTTTSSTSTTSTAITTNATATSNNDPTTTTASSSTTSTTTATATTSDTPSSLITTANETSTEGKSTTSDAPTTPENESTIEIRSVSTTTSMATAASTTNTIAISSSFTTKTANEKSSGEWETIYMYTPPDIQSTTSTQSTNREQTTTPDNQSTTNTQSTSREQTTTSDNRSTTSTQSTNREQTTTPDNQSTINTQLPSLEPSTIESVANAPVTRRPGLSSSSSSSSSSSPPPSSSSSSSSSSSTAMTTTTMTTAAIATTKSTTTTALAVTMTTTTSLVTTTHAVDAAYFMEKYNMSCRSFSNLDMCNRDIGLECRLDKCQCMPPTVFNMAGPSCVITCPTLPFTTITLHGSTYQEYEYFDLIQADTMMSSFHLIVIDPTYLPPPELAEFIDKCNNDTTCRAVRAYVDGDSMRVNLYSGPGDIQITPTNISVNNTNYMRLYVRDCAILQ